MNIAVTGASGFIGLELVQYCLSRGLEVKALVRKDNCAALRAYHAEIVETGSLDNCNDWGFLEGVDVVVHAAGQLVTADQHYSQLGIVFRLTL